MIIPNLPTDAMVDKDGNPTDVELVFRQNLVSQLQANLSNEGFVIPTQTAANIIKIQNHTIPDPTVSGGVIYTCQFGTMLYNSTANSIMAAINDGTGKPIFKTVTLT